MTESGAMWSERSNNYTPWFIKYQGWSIIPFFLTLVIPPAELLSSLEIRHSLSAKRTAWCLDLGWEWNWIKTALSSDERQSHCWSVSKLSFHMTLILRGFFRLGYCLCPGIGMLDGIWEMASIVLLPLSRSVAILYSMLRNFFRVHWIKNPN